MVGGLGVDVLRGNGGDDVLVGGTEDFNPFNRDHALGGDGNDVFIWAPGDGSDFFDGGKGHGDTVVFGLLGEDDGSGQPVFQVQNDQNFDALFINPANGLPVTDVANSPGFCTVIDDATSASSAHALDKLNLDHLVRFSIRAVADAFEQGAQSEDNGVRVTLHLRDVEYLVCTTRDGGVVEVLDLTQTPPAPMAVQDLPANAQAVLYPSS